MAVLTERVFAQQRANLRGPGRLLGRTARCGRRRVLAARAADEDKGLFSFVTDNASSRTAVYVDGDEKAYVGEMTEKLRGRGLDNGRYIATLATGTNPEYADELTWFIREGKPEPANAAPAPHVVLLHGVPLQSYCYREVLTQLTSQGLTVTAFDWIGAGFSEAPQPGYGFAYTEAEYMKALDLLMTTLGLDAAPISLVVTGFVTGSYGIAWALKNPGRVNRLAILNSPLAADSKLPAALAVLRAPLFIGEFASQNALIAEQFIEGGSRYVLGFDDADIYRKPFLEGGAAGFALLEAVRQAPLPELNKRIANGLTAQAGWVTPTLVLWGTDDKYLSVKEADSCASANPGVVSVKRIEAAGNCPSEDWPEKVVTALAPFLRSDLGAEHRS